MCLHLRVVGPCPSRIPPLPTRMRFYVPASAGGHHHRSVNSQNQPEGWWSFWSMAVLGMFSQCVRCCLNAVGAHRAASRILHLADLEIWRHKFVKDYEVPKDRFVLTNLIETDGSIWCLKARSSPRSREARPSRASAVPPRSEGPVRTPSRRSEIAYWARNWSQKHRVLLRIPVNYETIFCNRGSSL